MNIEEKNSLVHRIKASLNLVDDLVQHMVEEFPDGQAIRTKNVDGTPIMKTPLYTQALLLHALTNASVAEVETEDAEGDEDRTTPDVYHLYRVGSDLYRGGSDRQVCHVSDWAPEHVYYDPTHPGLICRDCSRIAASWKTTL